MTTADPTRSPAGTESAWAYTHLPRRFAGDPEAVDAHVAAGRGRGGAGRSGLRRPGSGTARAVARRTSRRRNASLVGGALNAGTSALHQELVFRPTPGLGRRRRPRSTGSTWPARPRIPAAASTAPAAGTPPAPRCGPTAGWAAAHRTGPHCLGTRAARLRSAAALRDGSFAPRFLRTLPSLRGCVVAKGASLLRDRLEGFAPRFLRTLPSLRGCVSRRARASSGTVWRVSAVTVPEERS